MKVVVTGASGFIGQNLVRYLRAKGLAVRPTFRASPEEEASEAIVTGDLEQFQGWPEALKGSDAVIHLAARAHRPRRVQLAERDLYQRLNVLASTRVAQAAAASGVKHFIFASSIGVNGRTTDGRAPFKETDRPQPEGVYAETKAEAEVLLGEIARNTGMRLTIIRPVLVYGPGAKANVGALKLAIRKRLPLPLGSVKNRRAFVAVDNFSSLVFHRLHAPFEDKELFIVADDEQVSTADFIRGLAAAMGKTPILLPFPPPLLKAGLGAVGLDQMAESLCGSLEVDTSEAKRAGWKPELSMQDALNRYFGPG